MKNLGIIVEYNPCHNGHGYHISESQKITKAKNTVAIMSGNFVQRGETAIFDKWERTKMALLSGVDMVLELPVMYATSSAENFAYGAISILDKSNIITDICYGSECGDISEIKKVANLLNNENELYKNLLNSFLKEGNSYPVAREKAFNQAYLICGENILSEPNNILGIEYEKAILKLNSSIKTNTITRLSAHYHSENIENNTIFASSTAIRKAINNNDFNILKSIVSGDIYTILEENYDNISNMDLLYDIFVYKMMSIDSNYFKGILDITEGLENKIINEIKNSSNFQELISNVKSKRYTYTKIKRGILHILLDIKVPEIGHSPEYIRVLGFKKDKEFLLKELIEKSDLPVVINLKHSDELFLDNQKAKDMLSLEIKSTDIYNLTRKTQVVKNYEFKKPLVIL